MKSAHDLRTMLTRPAHALVAWIRKRTKGNGRSERGIALIFVLSLTGVILALLGEILYQSQITVRTSVGERDRVKAEMSALTGAQFAKMLIGIEAALAALTGEQSGLPKEVKAIVETVQQTIKSQLGGKNLSQILDGYPIGAEGFEEIKNLSKLNISAMMDEKLLAALKAVPGYFVLKTTNESGKFNLNLLEGSEKKVAFLALKRIFSQPSEAKFLEDKGFKPERLAANVLDYVDRDNSDEIDKGDEGTQYTQAKFDHVPKNGKLESIEELRRVPGFNDDEIFNVFSPYFTVWPMDAKEKSLDVNAAAVELLAALFTQENQEVNDGEFDKLEDNRAENQYVTTERDLPNVFPAQDAESKLILSRLLGVRSSVYRVEVRGVSNGIERQYTMVLTAGAPKGKTPPPGVTPTPVPSPGAPPVPAAADTAASGTKDESPVKVVYQRFQ